MNVVGETKAVATGDLVGSRAVVHENELAALKDSRERDLPVFKTACKTNGDSRWVVAVSDHQAKLALLDYLWPMEKLTKRERDEQYTRLLEKQLSQAAG